MRSTRLPSRLTACLTACLLVILPAAILPACSPPPAGEPAVTAPPAVGSPTETDSLRAHYQALAEELQQTVLELKQQSYLDRAAYEDRIAELESELERLREELNSPAEPDRPVSGTPTQPPPQEQETRPSASEAAFRFAVEDGTVTILAYMGEQTHITVPAAIDRYPVTRIADGAFRGTAAHSITLPDTVTEIGWFTFADCPSLTSVALSSSVESIGYGAFDGCDRLTIIAPADSYAAAYAKSFAIPHKEN